MQNKSGENYALYSSYVDSLLCNRCLGKTPFLLFSGEGFIGSCIIFVVIYTDVLVFSSLHSYSLFPMKLLLDGLVNTLDTLDNILEPLGDITESLENQFHLKENPKG